MWTGIQGFSLQHPLKPQIKNNKTCPSRGDPLHKRCCHPYNGILHRCEEGMKHSCCTDTLPKDTGHWRHEGLECPHLATRLQRMASCVHRLALGVLTHQEWEHWFPQDGSAGRPGEWGGGPVSGHLHYLQQVRRAGVSYYGLQLKLALCLFLHSP